MQIDRDNYEEYFIDYLDGNMNPKQMKALVEFLQNNPDLEAELNGTDAVVLQQEPLAYGRKEDLYREKYDSEDAFEEFAVARMEGDLPESEAVLFDRYLSARPSRMKEFALYQQTRLKADPNLLFPEKKRLYRQTAGRTILLWSSRIAAILLAAALVLRIAGFRAPDPSTFENPAALSEGPGIRQPAEPSSTPITPTETRRSQPTEIAQSTPKTEAQIHRAAAKTFVGENRVFDPQEKTPDPVQRDLTVPNPMKSLQATLPATSPERSLAAVTIREVDLPESSEDEWQLTDFVLEKTGLNNLSAQRMAKTGLDLVSALSRDKFGFKTNDDGEITTLSYDSRLFALSIPTKE